MQKSDFANLEGGGPTLALHAWTHTHTHTHTQTYTHRPAPARGKMWPLNLYVRGTRSSAEGLFSQMFIFKRCLRV